MRLRPEPLDLARRTATSVANISPADAACLRRNWDQTFGRAVHSRTGKPVFGGIRWHAFSWEFTRAESGARALALYAAEPRAKLFAISEEDEREAFEFEGCAPIDFSPCDVDLYVVPSTLDWTMVFTHEQPDIGPFFCRRTWVETDPNANRRSGPVNCVYFACVDDHQYVDAGYRWAYWTLEEAGVVQRNHDVDIERLLAANEYWNPPVEAQSAWLCGSVLPAVRSFLRRHAGHRVVYVDEDRFVQDAEHGHEW
jgi:hypothetical protein